MRLRPFRCPICSKLVTREAATFPFCGERCRLVDLGQWFGRGYRIPGPLHPLGGSEDEREEGSADWPLDDESE